MPWRATSMIEKILLYGLVSSIGVSILEFTIWFIYLFYILKQKNIITNLKKSALVCIPFKVGVTYYIYKYGLGDVDIFRTIGILTWKSVIKNIDAIRVRYTPIHYVFCIIEITIGLILNMLSWILTPLIILVGIVVIVMIMYIIEPIYNLIMNKKTHIKEFLKYLIECLLLGLESLPKVSILY